MIINDANVLVYSLWRWTLQMWPTPSRNQTVTEFLLVLARGFGAFRPDVLGRMLFEGVSAGLLRRSGMAQMAAVMAITLPCAAPAKTGVDFQMALGNPSSAAANAAQRTNYLIARDQYALSYNDDTHQANWVIRGGMLRIRFLQRSEVTYTVESARDLRDWTGGGTSEPTLVQPHGLPEGYVECEASTPVSGDVRFMRVGVSIPVP